MAAVETFSADERRVLAPHFTNLDGPVFALTNLPEVVKGALFARYSRSAKSLRRLFLDEFVEGRGEAPEAPAIGTARADRLYQRVLGEYGDDSVAQLGGVHLACEGASNLLTKVLEWGRLMAYLEQSPRYVPHTDRPDGRFKYHVPAEIEDGALRARFSETLDRAFVTYARLLDRMREQWSARLPLPPGENEAAWRATIRAKALDSVRGLLTAATRSNAGRRAARERRPLRQPPGVRGAAAPDAGASAARGPRLRRPHPRGAAPRDPRVSRAARAPGARRRVEPVPRGDARGDCARRPPAA